MCDDDDDVLSVSEIMMKYAVKQRTSISFVLRLAPSWREDAAVRADSVSVTLVGVHQGQCVRRPGSLDFLHGSVCVS
jgi:hypothetical protein